MTLEELQAERQRVQVRLDEIDSVIGCVVELEDRIKGVQQQYADNKLPFPLASVRRGNQDALVREIVRDLREQQTELLNPVEEVSPIAVRKCRYCWQPLAEGVVASDYCKHLCQCGHECQQHGTGSKQVCTEDCDCQGFKPVS